MRLFRYIYRQEKRDRWRKNRGRRGRVRNTFWGKRRYY